MFATEALTSHGRMDNTLTVQSLRDSDREGHRKLDGRHGPVAQRRTRTNSEHTRCVLYLSLLCCSHLAENVGHDVHTKGLVGRAQLIWTLEETLKTISF